MSDQLKEKTSSALFWSFIDKGGQQVIQLVFMIILARLLDPKEFGLVAVLTVFTVIATLLQDSGFSAALIRKADIDEEDYSSVFYFNILIGIVAYFILFVCAPFIADFYDAPILTGLSRFIFLSFLFSAFSIIQNVKLIREMDFRTNAKITFIAGIISGALAVWMAFSGYGAWSLAAQLVLQSFIRSLFLWFFVKWYPKARFAASRLKPMMAYSINLLIMSLLNQLAGSIYPIVIGKYFSMSQVGYYGQAYKLSYIPQSIVATSLQGVAYPVLSKVEDTERKKRIFRKIIRVSSFVSFPVMILLAIAAEPIISIVLSDKWLESVPILQILAVGAIVFPLYSVINSLVLSFGKSQLSLKVEVFRNILSICFILASVKYGILAMVAGLSLSRIIAFIVSFYTIKNDIAYRFMEMLKDIMPYFVISVCTFIPLYFLKMYIGNYYVLLSIQITAGFGLYMLIVKTLGSKVLQECIEFFKKKKIS